MYGLTLVWLITIVSSFAAFWRPQYGLYAYVFLATLRPHFLFGWAGSLANVSEIVGIAMLAAWALHGFGSWRLGRGRSITVMLVLFTGWVWISATQAVFPQPAYLWGIEMLKILAPFLVGITILDSPAQWRTLMWIIVGTQAYVGLELNLMYLGGYNAAGYGYGGMDNNSFGIALVSTMGPAFALAMTERRKWLRAAAIACTAILIHTTLLTFSRGAFVGLLVVGAATFLIMPKRPKYVLAILVIGAVTLRYVGPQLAERLESTFAASEERDGSAQSRVDLWRTCLVMAGEYPVFGVGARNFPLLAANYGWSAGKEAHSVWMQMLAETGVPGVGLLALFFGLPIVWLWPLARARITDENRVQTGVAMGVVLGVIGFAVAGQFVSLSGLEVPYYLVLTGAVLLKSVANQRVPAAAGPALTSAPRARGDITVASPPRVRVARAPMRLT